MSNIAEWAVVLVDDEPDSLDLLAEVLALNGAAPYRAASGTAGLSLLAEMTPRVIVVDLNMPQPDGWDVLAEIRGMSHLTHVPVIAITAYYSDRVENEAQRAGFDAFIRKPIKSSAFLELVYDLGA